MVAFLPQSILTSTCEVLRQSLHCKTLIRFNTTERGDFRKKKKIPTPSGKPPQFLVSFLSCNLSQMFSHMNLLGGLDFMKESSDFHLLSFTCTLQLWSMW